jgi:hypothetical protein
VGPEKYTINMHEVYTASGRIGKSVAGDTSFKIINSSQEANFSLGVEDELNSRTFLNDSMP